MARVNYPSSSAYAATPQTSWYIGNYKQRDIPSDPTDTIILIANKYDNRPDLMAYDLYGDPSYWWVFAIRNPNTLRDPVWDFQAGKSIIIPSFKHLKETLG